ncbi:uncharacterized protein JCM10292_000504 [Rhodotorula paludigena]|uniref:uncharacterized protein n=1 Tax=Rhodotorula paludigena TaxID=86838 RepID=UPI00316EA986
MPLRMKATSNADEAVLRAQHRAARKSRSKRTPRTREESLTPPRNPPKRDLADEDWGFDESSVPPEQAYKRTRTDDEFLEALEDAEQHDRGIGVHEDNFYSRHVPAYASYYGSAAGAAAGIDPGREDLAQMDDEEYAEWVRAGMWRRKNRDEVERLERAERERKEREERERRDNERRDREERERIRKLEERRKRKSKEEEESARKRYDEGWSKLHKAVAGAAAAAAAASAAPASSAPTPDGTPPPASASDATADAPTAPSTSSYPLRFTDFPWPLYPPMAFPPLTWPSLDDLTPSAISSFLLPDSLAADKHKATLRQAVLAYHPDRFERFVLRVPEEKEDVRERVRELGLRVSQVLNDLSKRGA